MSVNVHVTKLQNNVIFYLFTSSLIKADLIKVFFHKWTSLAIIVYSDAMQCLFCDVTETIYALGHNVTPNKNRM